MKGQIIPVKPGVHRLRVYVGRNEKGAPILRSETYHGTKRNAETRLARMIHEVTSGPRRVSSGRVAELLDRYLEHLDTNRDLSPTTLREYRRLISDIIRPAIGDTKVTKLGSRDLDKLYASLKKGTAQRASGKRGQPLSAASLRQVHAVISGALRQAVLWHEVDRNVAKDATPPTVHAKRVNPPSPEQVRAMITESERRDPVLATMLLLAAVTGARRGELCALRWTDWDQEVQTLTFARSVYDKAGGGWGEKSTKTHQLRTISLDPFVTKVLSRHRALIEKVSADSEIPILPGGFIFSRSPSGAEPIRPDHATKFAQRVAEAVGIDTHLHMLRHFSATQLLAQGVDVVTTAGRLGHKDRSTTLNVYAHVLAQRDREAAVILGKTLELPPAG